MHTPMTPQAARPPALPVLSDSSLSPFPRSSVPYILMSMTGSPYMTRHSPCGEQWNDYRHALDMHTSRQVPTTYPTTLSGPFRVTSGSSMVNLASPCASLRMFPRSPTWRDASVGAPCASLEGLKCDPAEAQPEDRSPPVLSTCLDAKGRVVIYGTH